MSFNPISILSGGIISGSSPSAPTAPTPTTSQSTFTPGNYNFGNWGSVIGNSAQPNLGSNLNAQTPQFGGLMLGPGNQSSVNALAPTTSSTQMPTQIQPQAPVGVAVPSVNMLAQQFNSSTPRAM
jgi:hypothetical protein